VTVDTTPPNLRTIQRPDLIIINEKTKCVVIVDVIITSQSHPDCLKDARQGKIDKYQHIANKYYRNGYTVLLDAVVFGDVGGTDEENDRVMQELSGASPRYIELMHRFCVAGVLRHGHKIWSSRCNHAFSRPLVVPPSARSGQP
jgi:hypothetical protein